MKTTVYWEILLFFLTSCQSGRPFLSNSVPAAPDYSRKDCWAALPTETDNADKSPNSDFPDLQNDAQVDVFFLHPTILIDKSEKGWNADVTDEKMNKQVDESTILFQASAFNGAGRVYAPRYRQAHYRCFFSKDKVSSKQSLDIAYEDVKTAFEYYLKNYNHSRPIILAAHSQGSLHAKRLLHDFFEDKNLRNRLVVAYLVGWPIQAEEFKDIPVCQNPEQTGCFCTWRSFKYGYLPEDAVLGDSIAVTNPLTWRTDKSPADKLLNEGMIARKFEEVLPARADAQVHDGVLWVHKPKFPGSFFFRRKNYHIADYNLFYINVRKNAQHRVDLFWK